MGYKTILPKCSELFFTTKKKKLVCYIAMDLNYLPLDMYYGKSNICFDLNVNSCMSR